MYSNAKNVAFGVSCDQTSMTSKTCVWLLSQCWFYCRDSPGCLPLKHCQWSTIKQTMTMTAMSSNHEQNVEFRILHCQFSSWLKSLLCLQPFLIASSSWSMISALDWSVTLVTLLQITMLPGSLSIDGNIEYLNRASSSWSKLIFFFLESFIAGFAPMQMTLFRKGWAL